MKTNSRMLIGAGIGVALVAVGMIATVYSGIYDVGADAPHTRPVFALLDTARQHSVAARAQRLQVPADLDDPARIRQGAGNYDAMCASCHLSPGSGESELSRGLYPSPPDLSRESVDAAAAFWTIKHGIKASGMPAWGRSMDDEYIWNMAAFLQQLPKLDKAGYAALVAGSEGHSHGGGETGGHGHGGKGQDDDPAEAATQHSHGEEADKAKETMPSNPQTGGHTHTHADGSHHAHAAAPTTPPVTPAQPSAPELEPVDGNREAEEGQEHEHKQHEH